VTPSLSKSRFLAGVQCSKRLYLQVHQPELADGADESTLAIIEQGIEVGLLAQKRYAGGIAVAWGDGGFAQAIRDTRELISNPEVPAVFEAAFEDGGVAIRSDIIQRRGVNRVHLIEVKSSQRVKDHYLYDVAIQKHVLSGAGIDVERTSLMHLDSDYVYDGDQYDLGALFTVAEITAETEIHPREIAHLLKRAFEVIEGREPKIKPGKQCSDPMTCEFFNHCNVQLPVDHVSHLPGMRTKRIEELALLGVTSIQAIPKDFSLSDRQLRACESIKSAGIWIAPQLGEVLAGLTYPLCFLDFETIFPALPRFAGMRTYQQIPFQWSLHRQESSDAPLEHAEFLAEDTSDPRPMFIESLCRALQGAGSVVVYNQPFESSRLSELILALPQYADEIAAIKGRFWDLLHYVRQHVYHPEFGGSYSLKKVLPALLPDMRYTGMEVGDGGQAGIAWQKMIAPETPAPERRRLRRALLDYCGQDTLALARLVDFLRYGKRAGGRAAIPSVRT
jgi:predicted RecB family nuclease